MKPRGWRGAAAAASVLLLVGCAPTPLPDGPSDEEIDAFYAASADSVWGALDLPSGVARPVVAREEAIAEDTWAATYVQCMADSGYTNYKAEQGGYSAWSEGTGPSVEEQVASYVCQIRFPWAADPRFVLGDAQREYVYTYYAGFLIPCLETRGHAVVGVPSRDEFLDIEMGVWNPYYVIELPRDRADDERLRAECPEMPVGLRE